MEETGKTYAENACLKAVTLCRESGLITLADDSGIEVKAKPQETKTKEKLQASFKDINKVIS